MARLSEMVHVLDVGGVQVSEASGFEAIRAGARERVPVMTSCSKKLAAINLEPRYTLRQLVLYTLKLGSIGFGGPVALVGYMYRTFSNGASGLPRLTIRKV